VSTPENSGNDDLHLDLRFTDRPNALVLPLATAAAAVIILIIFASMTTNLAAWMLPMEDRYLQVLVPQAPDGQEALSLTMLDYPITGNTLSITGTVVNRTDFPITGLVAVVNATDVKYVSQTVEVPITPADLPAKGTGSFQATITLADQPGGYNLRFRLADGPLVPHHDDRGADLNVPAAK
jgi:hypothetical protein